MMRRFQLEEPFTDCDGSPGAIVVAWGVAFPDGSVVLRWHKRFSSTDVYESGFEAVLIHHASYQIVWLDRAAFVEEAALAVEPQTPGRHASDTPTRLIPTVTGEAS